MVCLSWQDCNTCSIDPGRTGVLGRTVTGFMGKIVLLVTARDYLKRKQDKAGI
jgi:hypothetical protein